MAAILRGLSALAVMIESAGWQRPPMMRVMFDSEYIDDLADYYCRNECIREQQYLSQEKLLHLAAFCLSKVASNINKSGDTELNNAKAEAALDAIRKISVLCDQASPAARSMAAATIVLGHTSGGRQNEELNPTTSSAPTSVRKWRPSLARLSAAAASMMCAVRGRLNNRSKTNRL